MIAVSVDEGGDYVKRVKDFVNEYKIHYTVAIDGMSLSKKFGVYTIPSQRRYSCEEIF